MHPERLQNDMYEFSGRVSEYVHPIAHLVPGTRGVGRWTCLPFVGYAHHIVSLAEVFIVFKFLML